MKKTLPKPKKTDSFHLQTKHVSVEMPPNTSATQRFERLKNLRIISNIVLYFAKKCWMTCSASVFVIFVIYWCYGSLLALVLFFFALSGLLFQVSDILLYHPDQPPQSRIYVPTPSLYGIPAESIFIKTTDGVKLHCFFIKQDPISVGKVPTILYLHGNAGNIGHRLPNVKGLYENCKCNILLLEYRGYGLSEGSPCEEGLYIDAQAGLQYLLQVPCIEKTKIIVFGRSLGGAVAIDLVSRPKFGKHVFIMIVENTFTSIPDIARQIFNIKFVKWLPNWAFKNQFFSIKKVKEVNRPCLFISGQADLLIPPTMMKLLCQVCGSQMKRLHSYEFGTHNETWQCNGYYHSLNLFIDDILLLQQETNIWPSPDGGEIY